MRYLILILSILIYACGSRQNNTAGTTAGNNYSLPEIPTFISDPRQRNLYISEHYWDKFNFGDTSLIGKSQTESFFADYLRIVALIPHQVPQSLDSFWKKAGSHPLVRNYYISLFDKYWGHPNSPYRDEELYIAFLEGLLSQTFCDSLQLQLYGDKLSRYSKNRVGSVAADLTLLSYKDGKLSQISLSDISSEYTLLYFNNPECQECMRYTYILGVEVAQLLSEKDVQVLSIYPDEDIELWKGHQLPSQWIKSFDSLRMINGENAYFLPAIPTLYLLDREKRVLLKDCTIDKLVGFLANQQ